MLDFLLGKELETKLLPNKDNKNAIPIIITLTNILLKRVVEIEKRQQLAQLHLKTIYLTLINLHNTYILQLFLFQHVGWKFKTFKNN
jgi:hypothetical protein